MSEISELFTEVKSLAPDKMDVTAEVKKLVKEGNTERGALNILKSKLSIRTQEKKELSGYWLHGSVGDVTSIFWVLVPGVGVETIFVQGSNKSIPDIPKFAPVIVKVTPELNLETQRSSLTCIGPQSVKKVKAESNPVELLSSILSVDRLTGIHRKEVIAEGFVAGVQTPRWENGRRLEKPLPMYHLDGTFTVQLVVRPPPDSQSKVSCNVKVTDVKMLLPLLKSVKTPEAQLKQNGLQWLGNQLSGERVIFLGFCTTKTPDGKDMRGASVSPGKSGFIMSYSDLYKELQQGGGAMTAVPKENKNEKLFLKKVMKRLKAKKIVKISYAAMLAKKYHIPKSEGDDILSSIIDGKKIILKKNVIVLKK